MSGNIGGYVKTARTRNIWVPAQIGYTPSSGIKDPASRSDYLGGIRMEHTPELTTVLCSILRPADYVSGGKYTAVFDGNDEGYGHVRLNYRSEAIANGETFTHIQGIMDTIDVSETLLMLGGIYYRTDGTQQNLPTWDSGEVMMIAVRRDTTHIDDDAYHIGFLGFIIEYTADM